MHKKGTFEKFAIAEQARTNQHPILWDETTVIDQARIQTKVY